MEAALRALLVALLAALVAGCAGGEAAPVSAPGATDQLLTRADVEREPAGSPERALLEWWRSAQFANAVGYEAGLAAALRAQVRRDDTRLQALDYLSAVTRSSRPVVLEVERDGQSAVVYSRIVVRSPIGVTRYVESTAPRAFPFVRERGRWVLADDAYAQSLLPETLRR